MEDSALEELLQILEKSESQVFREHILKNLLGLTGTKDGLNCLLKASEKCVSVLCQLLQEEKESLRENALKCLINLTSEEPFSQCIVKVKDIPIIDQLFQWIIQKDKHADLSCRIISNITHWKSCCEQVLPYLQKERLRLEHLVEVLCDVDRHSDYHYVASVLCNLTQLPVVQEMIMDRNRCLLQQLLPFTTYMDSSIRRAGIVGVLRNCCFDTDCHEWLLGDSVDILPHLLLPLAGPEQFPDDEMEKLPIDLQYLSEDKKREPEPDIRKMLIEAITQLCATKYGRTFLRDKQTYIIMRELHKWEKSYPVLFACENLVDILIGDDPEPGMENLKNVEIPSDLTEKFEKEDQQLLSTE
ncbi:protein HGH1 homolog [Limulus polyphemus]|uniref:Protein HGH1 homolog n=1 Tax=Limulus polyphemus TaxID=6850 RepID=A0ABM1TFE1_LIMPO|nr:protein HGH1 homolog [Limulus polyphemus]XP_022254597.1 protein HGH1 homolog [Limulus polyphemus]